MFANFKLSGGGTLDEAPLSRVHKRSATGCLPCRSVKKKCDEQKPVCSRCRRWGSSDCTWPYAAGEIEKQPWYSRSLLPRPVQYAEEPGMDGMRLAQFFENVHAVPYVGSSSSLVRLFEQCVQWPALLNAYAACGAAMQCHKGGRWVERSLAHHVQATRMLSETLSSNESSAGAECTMAVINALHIFETLRHDSGTRSSAHLRAGRSIFLSKVGGGRSPTGAQALLLEEFAFQLAVSSTFALAACIQLEDYWDMQQLLMAIPQQREDTTTYEGREEYADMGIAPDFFDYLYRLSFLRRHVPLRGWYREEALHITAQIQEWKPVGQPLETAVPRHLIVMAHLYRIGCAILAAKILDPLLPAKSASITSMAREGLEYLREIQGDDAHMTRVSVLIWPILMLSLVAADEEQRETCLRLMRYMLDVQGIGCIRGALAFLEQAWKLQQDGSHLGWDALFRDDLLGEVMF